MKNEQKSKEQVENDNLSQVQGYPDFETAPKGEPTTETEQSIQKINDGLNDVYPNDDENFLFYQHFDEMMERSIVDLEFQEQAFRMEEFYGR
jgi:hypothetical protein